MPRERRAVAVNVHTFVHHLRVYWTKLATSVVASEKYVNISKLIDIQDISGSRFKFQSK